MALKRARINDNTPSGTTTHKSKESPRERKRKPKNKTLKFFF